HGFLERDVPELPRVGFLLSTSGAEDSHEWEAFQSGVFSHEVRSALRGAADLDGDGKVTYREAAAFIYMANRAIENERFRPRFLARAPRDSEVLVEHAAHQARLEVGEGARGHHFVEDRRGERLADFNPGDNGALDILLPRAAEDWPLFVREVGSDR